MANHCPQELEACSGRIERSRKNGAKGGRPPKKTETYETQQVNGQKTQQVSEDLGKNNLWVCNNTKLNRTSPKGPDQSSGQGNEATEIPIAGLIDLKACLQTFPGLEPSPSAIAPASEAAGRPVVASDGVAGGMTGGGAVLLTSEPEIGAQVASIADRAPHLAADGLPFPDPGSRAAGTNPRANGTSLRQRGSNPRLSRKSAGQPPSMPTEDGTPMGDAWAKAVRLVQHHHETAWKVWLSRVRPVDLNGELHLEAETTFVRQWVEDRFLPLIERAAGVPVSVTVAVGC